MSNVYYEIWRIYIMLLNYDLDVKRIDECTLILQWCMSFACVYDVYVRDK